MNRYRYCKNIVLIGMSGVGKTAVGKYIASKLNMKFIDTDDMIVSACGKSIDSIFTIYGEDYFRSLESQTIESISTVTGAVISTGGGVVLNSSNIEALKRKGLIFLLEASIDTLLANVESSPSDKEKRPLLKNTSCLRNKIKQIYFDRRELYLLSANERIYVDNKTVDKIGDEIIFIFKQLNPCS